MSERKAEKLYRSIGDIDEQLVEEAQRAPKKRAVLWPKRAMAAAGVCIVGLGAVLAAGRLGVLPGVGGNSGSGGGEGCTYMAYAGPVFPLAAKGDTAGITAERAVEFDFSPYRSVVETYEDNGGAHSYTRYDSETLVADEYVLSNSTDKDVTFTALYPFAAGFSDKRAVLPRVTLDGAQPETTLYAGPYSGGFMGAIGSKEMGTVNLKQLDNWEGYAALFENGYMERAFDEWPQLQQPVVVYELSDRTAPAGTDAPNPTLNMEFSIDYEKTTILTYGFSGGSQDAETGYCSRNTHIPQSFNPDYGQSAYLVVLGEDIGEYRLQGYADGGCDEGEEISGVGATVTRRETTLGQILREVAELYQADMDWEMGRDTGNEEILGAVSQEMFLGAAAELLYDYGVLAENAMERYDFGMLEEILSETRSMQRVMYLAFDVTVPAKGSTVLTASMTKRASMDYMGKNRGRDGYEMVTQMGSALEFVQQSAAIRNAEEIEIVGQNFGFDPANGITEVTLDPAQEQYYLQVRKVDRAE